MNMNRSVGVLAAVSVLAVAQAGFVPSDSGYDVLLTQGKGVTTKYHVSSDLKSWVNNGPSVDASFDFRGSCGIGDGYLYWGDNGTKSALYRRRVSGGDVSGNFEKVKDNLPGQVAYLVPSHDKVWFYGMTRDFAGGGIYKIKIADPSVNVQIVPTYTATAPFGPNNIRYMTVARDGTLWIASRGASSSVDKPGGFFVNCGLYRYDTTVGSANQAEVGRYPLYGYGGGGMIFFDHAENEVYAGVADKFYRYGIDEPTSLGTLNNPCGRIITAGTCLGGETVACGYSTYNVFRLKDGAFETLATLGNVANVGDIVNLTDCADTGTKLPNVKAVWYFNEAGGNAIINGALLWAKSTEQKYGATANNVHLVQMGVTDAVAFRAGAFRAGGFANITASTDLISASGDFSVLTWGAFAEGDAERAILANGTDFIGLKGGKVTFASGATEISGATTVTDEVWHHVGVIRRGGKIEIWVDGAVDAQADFAGTIAQNAWQIGASGGVKTLSGAYLDELRVYPDALPVTDVTYLFNLPQPRPGAVRKSLSSYGSKIVKEAIPLYDEATAVESTLAIVGGNYYVSAGKDVYKSTDKGESWSKIAATTTAPLLSLFADGNSLKAVSRVNAAGSVWLLSLSADETTWTQTAMPGDYKVPELNTSVPVLSDGRVYLGTCNPTNANLSFGLFSFAYVSGIPSDPKCVGLTLDANTKSTRQNKVAAATAFADATGGIHVYGSLENGVTDFPEVRAHATASSDGSSLTLASTDYLPGSSKKVAIAYDPVSARYWAVTCAQHASEYGTMSWGGEDGIQSFAQNNAGNLSLYCSDDLVGWRFAGDIIAANRREVVFGSPAIAFDGDDLLIAFTAKKAPFCINLASPAGLTTYQADRVLFQKVPGFRALDVEKKIKHKMLVVDYKPSHRLLEFFRDDNGDWLPIREFKGTFGGKTIEYPRHAIMNRGSFFFSGEGNRPIWQFSFDGDFRRTWTQENDALLVTKDGKYAYSTGWFANKFFRTDLTAATPSPSAFTPDVGGASCRTMVELKDGTVAYIPNRDDYKTAQGGLTRFFIMNRDGTCLTPDGIGIANSQCQNMGYDEENDVLYLACGATYKLEHPTVSSTAAQMVKVGNFGGNVGTTFYGPERRLVQGNYGTGYCEFWDMNGYLMPKYVIGSGAGCYDPCAYKNPPNGLTVLIK